MTSVQLISETRSRGVGGELKEAGIAFVELHLAVVVRGCGCGAPHATHTEANRAPTQTFSRGRFFAEYHKGCIRRRQGVVLQMSKVFHGTELREQPQDLAGFGQIRWAGRDAEVDGAVGDGAGQRARHRILRRE